MAATSSLPPQPAAASGAAVDAAAADVNAKEGAASSSGEAAAETGASSSSTGGGGNNASEIRTVFTDPENFNAKHPLYHNWTLWFDNPSAKGMTKAAGGKDSWGEEMKRVVDFDSVEEFWGLYNNVIPPSMLPQRANYYLFKEGVKPAWEDPANADGGKWAVQMPRDKSRESIDKLWLFTVCVQCARAAFACTSAGWILIGSSLIHFADALSDWRDSRSAAAWRWPRCCARARDRRYPVCTSSVLPRCHLDTEGRRPGQGSS